MTVAALAPEEPTVEEQSDRLRTLRRRFLVVSGAGAVAAIMLFTLLLQSGRSGLLDHDLLGNFYDGQARSLLDGRVDVDPDVAGFEGFRMGDETHIYQGIAPTLVRLPLLALTDRFDGRLTGVSMILAFAVMTGYLVALSWRIRWLVRGAAPLGPVEGTMTALGTFALAAGPVLFLASRAWVYHEALLWGVATSLVSLTHLGYWLTIGPAPDARRRRSLHLVAAVVAAGLALNTRSSIGGGPVLALGLVACCLLVDIATRRGWFGGATGVVARFTRRISGWQPDRVVTRVGPAVAVIVGGVLAALVLHVAVNVARFDSLVGVPLDRQALVANDVARQEALAANENSLFGLGYAPSVALQLLRPDAIGLRATLPFLGFPDSRPAVIRDVVFAERDWSSSVPASSPLLVLGAGFGIAVLVGRPRRLRRHVSAGYDVAALRLPAIGAAAGGSVVVVFGYMAQRYLSDLFPFLAVTSLVGLHALAAVAADRPGESAGSGESARSGVPRWGSRALIAALIAATSLWTVWANTGLALQYNREIAPGPTEAQRLQWLRTQADWGAGLDVVELPAGSPLPPRRPIGQVAIIGDCDALYRSNGTIWYRLESSPPGGRVQLTIGPGPVPRTEVTLARSRDGEESAELVLVPQGDGRFHVAVDRAGPSSTGRSPAGPAFTLAAEQSVPLQVTFDWRTGEALVTRSSDGAELLNLLMDLPAGGLEAAEAGAPGPGAELPITVHEVATPACDELRR